MKYNIHNIYVICNIYVTYTRRDSINLKAASVRKSHRHKTSPPEVAKLYEAIRIDNTALIKIAKIARRSTTVDVCLAVIFDAIGARGIRDKRRRKRRITISIYCLSHYINFNNGKAKAKHGQGFQWANRPGCGGDRAAAKCRRVIYG